MTTKIEERKSTNEMTEVTPTIRPNFTEEQQQAAFMKLRALAGEIIAIRSRIHPVRYHDGDDAMLSYSDFENKGYAIAIEHLTSFAHSKVEKILTLTVEAMGNCGHSYNIDEWSFLKEGLKECREQIAELLSLQNAVYRLMLMFERMSTTEAEERISYLGIDLLTELYQKITDIYKDPDVAIVDADMTEAFNREYDDGATLGIAD